MSTTSRALVPPTLALSCLVACTDAPRSPDEGVVVIAQETQAAWIRNFNPLLPPGAARWPSRAGIYEPLLVFSSATGEYVPWLAEAWAWTEEARVLRFTVREGVLWSDGTPLTAADVAYTFALLRETPALDVLGVWRHLASVEATDARTVVFTFERPYAPGLDDVAQQPIVPEHVWRDVADPLTFTNPDPVATGPFTEVRVFANQVYELGANPRYWQPGKPGVEALRFPAFPANDQANLALVAGDVDWAGNFVPAADRTFEARDPEVNDFWSPPVESTVFLYANTTRAPFDDVRVRKGLSMAIDRELLVEAAMYGYTHPADATGLSDAYAAWKDPTIGARWTAHDPEAAAALLAQAGDVGKVTLLTVAGWSDWMRAAQSIARDLGAVGVDVEVRSADFSGWFESVQRGDFDLALGWSSLGPTPYVFYRDVMGTISKRPVGEPAQGNWHRYASPAADTLLDALERTSDPAEQRRLVTSLQAVFAEEAPAVPLFPAPAWGAASTRYVTGFPSAEDPWAPLSPNRSPESLLVLTRLVSR